MADFYIKRGDTGSPIRATLRDQSGPVDLSGADVRFHMMDNVEAVKVDAESTVLAPGDGDVQYEFGDEDVDTAGEYRAEWEVTFADGMVVTFPNHGFVHVLVSGDVA